VAAIQDGLVTVEFAPEEWIVVRYCYACSGHSGAGSALVMGGEMSAEGFAQTQSMLHRFQNGAALRSLNANIGDGPAAGVLLLDLIRKKWKLPHVKNFDAGPVLFVGTKRLGKVADFPAEAAAVPRVQDIPTVAAALVKLQNVFGANAAPHAVVVTL